jgi:hypothetical protein
MEDSRSEWEGIVREMLGGEVIRPEVKGESPRGDSDEIRALQFAGSTRRLAQRSVRTYRFSRECDSCFVRWSRFARTLSRFFYFEWR